MKDRLTIPEVAKLLKVGQSTVYRLLREGYLKPAGRSRIGKGKLIAIADIEKMIIATGD